MREPQRLESFLASLQAPHPEGLFSYGREALSLEVPIIRDATADALRTFLAIRRPYSILEVGAGIGYSGLLMLTYAPAGAHLVTIEKDEERAALAQEAFIRFGFGDRARVLLGDATLILPSLRTTFDFVFMDAAKGQYGFWLSEVLAHMGPGSLLLSDNVLSSGEVLESRFVLPHRDRTRQKRMREYLHALVNNENLTTSVFPIGDGLAVSVWKAG